MLINILEHFKRKFFIIKPSQFNQIMEFKKYSTNISQRKALKRKLKWSIIESLQDEYYSYSDNTKLVFDEIIYKATDRGFSFNGINTLATKCNVSESTVKRVLRRLRSTGKVFVAYRKNPNGKGAKTPIVFFTEHPLFKSYHSFFSFPIELVSDTLKNETNADAPMVEGQEKVSTISLPSNNNNTNHSMPNTPKRKIIKYVPRFLQHFQSHFSEKILPMYRRILLAGKNYLIESKDMINEVAVYTFNSMLKYARNKSLDELQALTYTIALERFKTLAEQEYDELIDRLHAGEFKVQPIDNWLD